MVNLTSVMPFHMLIHIHTRTEVMGNSALLGPSTLTQSSLFMLLMIKESRQIISSLGALCGVCLCV